MWCFRGRFISQEYETGKELTRFPDQNMDTRPQAEIFKYPLIPVWAVFHSDWGLLNPHFRNVYLTPPRLWGTIALQIELRATSLGLNESTDAPLVQSQAYPLIQSSFGKLVIDTCDSFCEVSNSVSKSARVGHHRQSVIRGAHRYSVAGVYSMKYLPSTTAIIFRSEITLMEMKVRNKTAEGQWCRMLQNFMLYASHSDKSVFFIFIPLSFLYFLTSSPDIFFLQSTPNTDPTKISPDKISKQESSRSWRSTTGHGRHHGQVCRLWYEENVGGNSGISPTNGWTSKAE